MTNTPLPARARLADEVAADLRKRIGARRFVTGEQLPTEKVLGDTYGVSRSVVREAIAQLKSESIVTVQQGRGVFVAQAQTALFRMPDALNEREALREIYELRRAVEVEAAGLAALRRNGADLDFLSHELERMADGSVRASADVAFHVAVARATRNTLFEAFVRFLGAKLESAIESAVWNTIKTHPDAIGEVLAEHTAIVAAIKRGDAQEAEAAMADHLDRACLRLNLLTAFSSAVPGADGDDENTGFPSPRRA